VDKKKIELGWQASGGEIFRTWTFTDRNGNPAAANASVRSSPMCEGYIAVVSLNGDRVHMSEHGSQRDAARDCERAYDRAMLLRTLPGQRQPSDHDLDEDDDCEKSDA